jgi:hypothetical protein
MRSLWRVLFARRRLPTRRAILRRDRSAHSRLCITGAFAEFRGAPIVKRGERADDDDRRRGNGRLRAQGANRPDLLEIPEVRLEIGRAHIVLDGQAFEVR